MLLLGFVFLQRAKEIEYTPEIEAQITLVRQRFRIPANYIIYLARERASLFSEYDENTWKHLPNLTGGEPALISVTASKPDFIELIEIKDESDEENVVPVLQQPALRDLATQSNRTPRVDAPHTLTNRTERVNPDDVIIRLAASSNSHREPQGGTIRARRQAPLGSATSTSFLLYYLSILIIRVEKRIITHKPKCDLAKEVVEGNFYPTKTNHQIKAGPLRAERCSACIRRDFSCHEASDRKDSSCVECKIGHWRCARPSPNLPVTDSNQTYMDV